MTVPVLPPCSAPGCRRAAGANVNGDLLCGEHAIIAYKKLLSLRNISILETGNAGDSHSRSAPLTGVQFASDAEAASVANAIEVSLLPPSDRSGSGKTIKARATIPRWAKNTHLGTRYRRGSS